MKSLRSALLLCALWLVVAQPGSAQWMFEKKPVAKGSSFEVAEFIPADAQAVVGFALKGQVDVAGIVSDVKAAVKASGDDDIEDMESELGLPLERLVRMFNGRGYAALLRAEPGADAMRPWVLVLQLERTADFDTWLAESWKRAGYALKERDAQGFHIRELQNGTQLGRGGNWFYIASDSRTANRLAVTLSRKTGALADDPLFIKAQNSLTGGVSGVFAYVDGAKVRKTMFEELEMNPDEPGMREFAFWDFAVASIDARTERGDAFLGFNPDAGPLLTALRKPGRVNGALLDLLPGDQSTLFAADAGWVANTVDSLADEIPALAMFVGMAYTSLNEYGDFVEAFDGTFVMGANLPDVIAESGRQEMYVKRERGPLVACESNLKNIGTALEMYSTDWSGEYPDSFDKLTPNYLRTIPMCPTKDAKPYTYDLSKPEGQDYPVYLLKCVGHQHADQGVEVDHPQYSGMEGLLDGRTEPVKEEVDPNRPVPNALLDEPSMIVAVPVKSVAEAHNVMITAVETNRVKPAEQCGTNVENIGTALQMYASDHDGDYPAKLSDLIEGYYLYEVPTCPVGKADRYSETYKLTRGADDKVTGFSVYCKGHNHPELEADKPFYSLDEGLQMGPVAETPHPVPSQPAKGEKQSYAVDQGPKAVLDADSNILRLGYGPKAGALLLEPGARWSLKPWIADALSWAGNRALYLDYVDLEPMYAKLKQAFHQAAGEEDEGAKFLDTLTDRLRPRVGPLQGVSCVKVSEHGLHYRSQGVASTGQFLAGFVFGAMVYIPGNLTESRAQNHLLACKSNLKNIGTALEMWASDNGGKYPDSVEKLTPDYLRVIPTCPAAKADTYSSTYHLFERDGQDQTYEVYCKGHHHAEAGMDEDYPRYNGYDGLIEYPDPSPVEEATTEDAAPAPEGEPEASPTP